MSGKRAGRMGRKPTGPAILQQVQDERKPTGPAILQQVQDERKTTGPAILQQVQDERKLAGPDGAETYPAGGGMSG